MMRGDNISSHSQQLALDALDALDGGNITDDDQDLTAAISAALSADEDDDDAANDAALDQELQDEMVDFSLEDELNDKSIIDEAMDLLNDEVAGASLNGSRNKNMTNDDATQSSMASFSSVDFTIDNSSHHLENVEIDDNQKSHGKGNGPAEDEVATVPLQQFENAIKLIQDLEKQVDTLEAVKHQLQFENEQLRQQNDTQTKLIESYEKKLSEFPKLMEATIEEQTAVAHHVAKGAAKQSFWNEYMSQQEKLSAQEKKRRATATTTSLKQSDFLKNVVERQEKEKSKSLPGTLLQGWKSKWASKGTGVADASGDEPNITSNGHGSPLAKRKSSIKPDGNSSHLGIVAKDGDDKIPSTNEKILNLLT